MQMNYINGRSIKPNPCQSGVSNGFSLLELMIVLIIVAILATLAVPGFQSIIKQSNIVSARNSLSNAIEMARGEAIYRHIPATICASTNQSNCSGGSDWEQGWIVFSDLDQSGTLDKKEDTLIDVNYGFDTITIGTDETGGRLTFLLTGMKLARGQQIIGICDARTSSSLEGKAMQLSTAGSIRYTGKAGC